MYIYKNQTNYFSYGFSNESDLEVTIPNVGLFPKAISAYYALKNPSSDIYVGSLEKCTDNTEIESIFKKEPDTEEWEDNKEEYMYKVLKYKFEQHAVIKHHLINTGLRPIIFCSTDLFLGKMSDGIGRNTLGKILMKMRNIFLVKRL